MTAVDPIVVEVGEAPISVTVASTGLVLSVASGTVGPAGPKGDTGATGPAGATGATGATGPAGATGATGAAGQGVPVGGTTGQVLAKASGTNYDTEWVDQTGGGGGGSGTVTEVSGVAPITVTNGTTTPAVSISAATTSAAGSLSAADKSKLDGVAAGATANATDAQLRDRSTHTGTQTLSTVSDAGTAASKNVPAAGNASATEVVLGSDSRLTDARTPSSTLSHASTHGAAGSDPVTLAQSQVTNLTTDLAAKVPTSRTVNGQALSSDVTLTFPAGNNDMGRVSNAIYLTGSGLSVNGATSGNTATTPDAAALDITGDIEIVVRAAATDWTLASQQMLLAKRQTASTRSYDLSVFGGNLYFRTSTTGSDAVSSNSSVAVPFSAGQAGWVRVTRNATTGTVTYYTAPDSSSEPGSWTQLGTTQSTAASSIYSSNSQLEIGTHLGGGSPLTGTIYRAIVRSGIGGTTVFDANFATAAADALAFTESSSNAATVTITTTRYAYGVPGVQFTGTGTQALTANTVYYQPFEVTAPLTLDFMALEVTTAATASGNLRLGVYAADTNLQPTGAPLFDSGDVTVTSGATGILSKQSTPVTLQPGVYLTATNTSVALTARTALGGQTFVGTAMGSNLFTVLMSVAQTQGAFPNPGTAWTTRAAATGAARHVAQMRWR